MALIFKNRLRKPVRVVGAVLLLTAFFGLNQAAVRAQGGEVLRIQSVQTEAFPKIQLTFEVYDGEGNFKSGLQASQVQVIENGLEKDLTKLELLEPGLQMLFAINTGPELSALAGSTSYFEKIKQGLLAWGAGRSSNGLDDYSLIDNTGIQVIRSTDIQQWSQAVTDYAPDLMASRQSLASLNLALDMALESNPRPNMKRSLLYISPPPLVDHGQALPNLTDRAVRQGVEVNVWLVPTAGVAYPQGIEMLRSLAQATGGDFFQLSAQEELEDIESYFQHLRYIYAGEYFSEIIRGGNQSVSLKVNTQDYQSASQAFSFKLNVSPPSPVFLSPPSQVVRSWVKNENERAEVLEPRSQPIQILVEFPDGHLRDLARTILYVDGEPADENLQPPFDQFDWNLEEVVESGSFQLQVEAIDTLGLSQRTISLPIDVVVEQKIPTFLQRILSQGVLPFIIAISLAGVIVLSIYSLVRGKPLEFPKRKKQNRPYQAPVLQQQKEVDRGEQNGFSMKSHAWVSAGSSGDAPARLVALNENGEPLSGDFIGLNRAVITFGSDPKQATHILRESAISGLHARLSVTPEDTYLLMDAGSTAGTWVNLAPVPPSGCVLRHGDIIHFGRCVFRFELKNPPLEPRINVIPLEEGEPW